MKSTLIRFVSAAVIALALQHTSFAADTPSDAPGTKQSPSSSASTTRPMQTGTT